jgi:hypothetical protein
MPPDLFTKFASLPIHQLTDPFPRTLRGATLELASNNLICSVALTGVLALQAGRFWAEKSDAEEASFPAEIRVEDAKPRRRHEKDALNSS